MKRQNIQPRANWQKKVTKQGLTFHTPQGKTYWDESACYRFSSAEVDKMEKATNDLQEMYLQAAQHVIDKKRYAELTIPVVAIPHIEAAWEKEPPSIYGRMDLAFDGMSPPKLLEYNADTPTSLVEAAVIQWYWLQDVKPKKDQFNSIHEKLIAKWKDISTWLGRDEPLYLAGVDNNEDIVTLAYLEDVARQAGMTTRPIAIRDLGWNEKAGELRDLQENRIGCLFKLYPWEWLLEEGSVIALASLTGGTHWVEPIWKMLWSNKAMLAILWELFPDHPNLLATYLDGPRELTEYVRKPILSREGANVFLKSRVGTFETGGEYGEEGFVFQASAPTPCFEGNYPVIGSWVVTDQGSCGIGIRESKTPITDNLSRFVPHYFD